MTPALTRWLDSLPSAERRRLDDLVRTYAGAMLFSLEHRWGLTCLTPVERGRVVLYLMDMLTYAIAEGHGVKL